MEGWHDSRMFKATASKARKMLEQANPGLIPSADWDK